MSKRGMHWIGGLLTALLLCGDAAAAEADRTPAGEPASEPRAGRADGEDGPARAGSRTRLDAKRLSIYVPPSRGSTSTRTGGGTRGPLVLPELAALAPDHVGLTTRAQPTLAWFVDRPAAVALELTLLRDGALEPELETRISLEVAAGIAEASLADWGVALEEGAVYQWFVSLVGDPQQRDRDVVASGAIERVSAPSQLDAELAGGAQAHVALARHGIWYDALAELGRRIAAGEAELRAERAALLDQVGLGAPAAFDRAQLN